MEAFARYKDVIVNGVGVLIPPPGGMIVATVLEVAHWAVQAVFNEQSCCLLAKKCCNVLFVMASHQKALARKDAQRRAMEQLQAAANDSLALVRQFAAKGWRVAWILSFKLVLSYGSLIACYLVLNGMHATLRAHFSRFCLIFSHHVDFHLCTEAAEPALQRTPSSNKQPHLAAARHYR